MSKTWEHYHHAARNHEQAAFHFHEAEKYYKAQDLEKAAHHGYLAHGHSQHALFHGTEAAKFHAEEHALQASASENGTKKKTA